MMKTIHWFMCLALVSLPVWAIAAQPPTEAEKEATQEAPTQEAESAITGTFEVLEAKLCSGVQDKEPIDERQTFNTGDKAWLWLKLKPTGETTLRLRWSLNDEPVWTMDAVPVRLGRTWYYKTINQPGSWKVEILNPKDEVVHTVNLTVSGESSGEAGTVATEKAPPSKAAPEEAGTPAAEGENVEVVELKVAGGIENREPVNVTTTFGKGDKVYTWVKLNVKVAETVIKMRWYLNDQAEFTSDPVTVKQSAGWRTWLFKTVNKSGDWKVEILDADEKPVQATNFTVQ